MAIDAPLAAELLQQLKAAETWLSMLIREVEIDPETTTFDVKIVDKDGAENPVARMTLAQSMSQIAAAIAASNAAVEVSNG